MANRSMGFASEFSRSDLFFGEAFKIIPDCLYEGHVLFFLVSMYGSPILSLLNCISPSLVWTM